MEPSLDELISRLRDAASQMRQESLGAGVQGRSIASAKAGGRNSAFAIQTWGKFLDDTAWFIEAQQAAKVMPQEEILAVVSVTTDAAEEWLGSKVAVPA